MTPTPTDYQEFTRQGGFADLSDRAKLRLTGADRVRYLNGQVTSNVTALRPGKAVPACVTTAKGKLNAEIFISADADSLMVDAPGSQREELLTRLERYIIADDVSIEDVTESLALIHFIGADPSGIPALADATIHGAERFGAAGWDVLLTSSQWEAGRPDTQSRVPALTPELLEVIRVERGIPRWGAELTEATLPPEAGLERTHIDYHKGCYIGQEVISRLRSVGHVNRELVGFTLLAGDALAPGMRLFSPSDETRQIGVITSAAWSFALAKPIALGYLRHGSPRDDLIARPADVDVPTVHVTAQALPFVS